MAKKSISEKRAERERQENQTLQRVFNVFLLGLAAEVYLFIVYRGYVAGSVGSMLVWHQLLRWGSWIGLAAAVAGAGVGWWKREDKKLRTIMTWAGGVGAFLFVSGWIVTHFFSNGQGVTTMCILVPILAVLALVYLLYQHECFLCTAALAGSMFTVWVRGAAADSGTWKVPVLVGTVVGALVLAAAAYLVHKAQAEEGKLLKIRVFSVECDYRILYAALGVGFVGVAAALVVPAVAYYLMWVLGIALFAELAYYTTKMM